MLFLKHILFFIFGVIISNNVVFAEGKGYVQAKLRFDVYGVAMQQQPDRKTYLQMTFLLTSLLEKWKYSFRTVTPEQVQTAADLIRGFAVGLQEGVAVEEVINENCYKANEAKENGGKFGFTEDTLKKAQDAEKKALEFYEVIGTPPFNATGGDLEQLETELAWMRQLYFRLAKLPANIDIETVSKNEVILLLQYTGLAFDYAKQIISGKLTLDKALETLCETVKTVEISVKEPYGGIQLLKQYLREGRLSAAYLMAPIHTAVLGYLLMSY